MEQSNLVNTVVRYTILANNHIKKIIGKKLSGISEEIRKRIFVHDCCSPAVFHYLVSIMLRYIRNKRLDNGHLLSESEVTIFGGILAILFYYYHMVLIETLSNDVLKTKDMKTFGMDEFNIFMKLYPQLLAGDDPLDASIRQKFLGFSSDELGTSSIAVPTGYPEESEEIPQIQDETILPSYPASTIGVKRKYSEIGGKKKHRKTRRKHKSKRGKSRRSRRRLRTTV
jgi:hypothetical protein